MTLTRFIRENSEAILSGWYRHFENILPTHRLTGNEVRDHARDVLGLVLEEMETNESAVESSDNTSARRHGVQRQSLGVDLLHLAEEFRALRFDVARLWNQEKDGLSRFDFEELLRFNQILDDVLGESIAGFTKEHNRQNRLFKAMLNALPDPAYVLDLDGNLIYANAETTEQFHDIAVAELVEQTLEDLHAPAQSEFAQRMLGVIKDRKHISGEVEVLSLQDKPRFYEYKYAPVISEEGQVESVVGTARDITERKLAEDQAWHQATNDHLTGVPNLRLFQDRLKEQAKDANRTGASFALLFIDLDEFKEVNDTFGHDVGDRLLIKVARRITDCVRETDTVARLGGDEFAIILQRTTEKAQIEQIANGILEQLKKPYSLAGNQATISGSIGIAIFPKDADTVPALQKFADQAMYFAKQSGRNQLCFSSETLRDAALTRRELVRELRRAREQSQLQLHYQPIVELSTGRIAKAEALIRWQNPQKGLLMPADFIELAEETGVIQELEDWVLEEAASAARQWSQLVGTAFQISINKSPLQFIRPDSRESWQRPLENLNLAANSISIEFPEEVLMNDSADLVAQLSDFRAAGILLTLDHFGISGSPIDGLGRHCIDTLKVDRSFLYNIANDRGNQKSVEAIIAMAHTMNLKVIAEGVENAAQRDWLKAAGCDFAQGFFLSQPLSHEAFTDALSAPPALVSQ